MPILILWTRKQKYTVLILYLQLFRIFLLDCSDISLSDLAGGGNDSLQNLCTHLIFMYEAAR